MKIDRSESARFAGALAVLLIEILVVAWVLVRIVNVVRAYWIPGVPALPFWVAFWVVSLKVIMGVVSKTADRIVTKLRPANWV